MPTISPHPTPQRSYNMSRIRAKDTKPEIMVRKYLWNHGIRYRLNHKRLPGKPDVVLRKYGVCIFINGCFWHGHMVEQGDGGREPCRYFRMPHTRTDFWEAKINRNRERDIEVQHQLARMGWHCITIWECQLKPATREQILDALVYMIHKIYLDDHRIKTEA